MDLTLISSSPLHLSVTFAPGDSCFHGHFPDNPVVPGSLVMALCLDCLRTHTEKDAPLTIRRFSFARFARPGTYDLIIERSGEAYLCLLRRGSEIFAQGRIRSW